jgi:hypothetical protein
MLIRHLDAVYRQATDVKDLVLTSVTEDGVRFETGTPVTFTYIKNTEKAPRALPNDPYLQNIEPAGMYVNHVAFPFDPLPPGWVSGELSFQNPLVLQWGETGHYDDTNWKARLFSFYGKKGADLTRALLQQGYDGVVTTYEHDTSEIVSLSSLHRGEVYRQAAKPQQDLAYRQEAKRAYDKLIEFLKQSDLRGKVDPLLHDTGYALDFSDVDSKYEKLHILWFSSHNRKSLGEFGEIASHLYPESRAYQIKLFALGDNFFVDDEGYEKELYDSLDQLQYVTHKQIFTHEFIHYLDRLRRKKQIPFEKLKELNRKKTPSEYLSDPDEFNAWYQEKVSELDRLITKVGEKAPHLLTENWLTTFKDFMQLVRTQFTTGPIKWDLDILDEKYQRKLKKRLYGLWQHYQQRYGM